jgi:hypothetical protein
MFLKCLSVNRRTTSTRLGPAENGGNAMTSYYLDRPLIPLAVALPRALENIEAELTDTKLEAAEKRRLQERARLIRALLTQNRQPDESARGGLTCVGSAHATRPGHRLREVT